MGGTFYDPNDPRYLRVLMEWDGTSLTSFNGLENYAKTHTVQSMVEYKNELYIAGNIIPNQGVGSEYNDIMRWDGSTWKALGAGYGPGGISSVYSLAVMGDKLYFAGDFNKRQGNITNNIATWDGTNFGRLGNGVDNVVWGITAIGDTLHVAGGFLNVDNRPGNLYATWSQGQWCNNDLPVRFDMWCTVD